MATQIVSTALPPHPASLPVPPVFPMANPDFIRAFNRSVAPLDLSDGTVRLLELLLSYDLPDPRNGKQRKGFVWPSRATLAENLGIAERTLRKRLAALKAAGLIEELTAGELRQLRNQGFDIPDGGRGGGWRIDYTKLPDFQTASGGQADRHVRATQTGTFVPPYTRQSGKPETDNTNHRYNEVATNLSTTADGDGSDGGETTPPSLPEEKHIGPDDQDIRKQMQTLLRKWSVSAPQAKRIVQQVDADLIRQAIHLLKRNRALSRDRRVIVNPAGWIVYTLTIVDDPALPEWERRIANMEEENTAPEPTTRTVMIPELVPQKPAAAPPEPVEDEDPQEVTRLVEASFQEAEAQEKEPVPVFDVEVETADRPGTTASFFAGVKTLEFRYGSFEIPPEDEMNIFDPERTMPDPEPIIAVEELETTDQLEDAPPEDELTVLDDPHASCEVTDMPVATSDELPSFDGETCSDESGHIGEETQPGFTPSDQSEEKMLSPTPPHQPWHLTQADCKRLWQAVLDHLEEEGQWLPLLGQVSLRWERDTAVIVALGPAIGWALQNRVGRIQNLLQRLTGQALEVEVMMGRGDALVGDGEHRGSVI